MSELGTLLEREMQEIRPAGFTIADVAGRRERRRRRQRIASAVVALSVAAAVTGGLVQVLHQFRSQQRFGPGSGRNGAIVFVSPGDGGPRDRLFRVAPDGTNLRQLADVHVEYPAWSPDGSTIAFDDGSVITFRDWSDEQGHLHLMNADGTGLRQITGGEGAEFAPAWSPDGTAIAYTSRGSASASAGIFVLDLGTGARSRVTTNPYDGYLDKEPAYSPDGTRIVFVRDRQLREAGGTRDEEALFVVNVDGTGLGRLTAWRPAVGTPSWSPDGSTIVFRDGIVAASPLLPRIFRIDADGTNLRPLTDGIDEGSFWPSWSPDGTRIVFTRFTTTDGILRLFTMAPDGSDPTPLTRASSSGQSEASWGARPI